MARDNIRNGTATLEKCTVATNRSREQLHSFAWKQLHHRNGYAIGVAVPLRQLHNKKFPLLPYTVKAKRLQPPGYFVPMQ